MNPFCKVWFDSAAGVFRLYDSYGNQIGHLKSAISVKGDIEFMPIATVELFVEVVNDEPGFDIESLMREHYSKPTVRPAGETTDIDTSVRV